VNSIPGFTADAALLDAADRRHGRSAEPSTVPPSPPPVDQVMAQFCFRRGAQVCCTDPVLGTVCRVVLTTHPVT
jgi:hypothetical protein